MSEFIEYTIYLQTLSLLHTLLVHTSASCIIALKVSEASLHSQTPKTCCVSVCNSPEIFL